MGHCLGPMRNPLSLLNVAVEAVSQLASSGQVAQPDEPELLRSLLWTHQLQAGALASSSSSFALGSSEPISRT